MGFLTAFATGALQEGIAQQNSAGRERERMVEYAMEQVRTHSKKRDEDLERQTTLRGQARTLAAMPDIGMDEQQLYGLFDSGIATPEDIVQRRFRAGAAPVAAAAPEVAGGLAGGAPAAADDANRDGFLDRLSPAEGGGNPRAVNRQGYSGNYQFGTARLAELGLYRGGPRGDSNDWSGRFSIPGHDNVRTHQDFLNNPEAQRAAGRLHVRQIDEVIDKEGLLEKARAMGVDRDGLRSVAHLGGVGGMRRFVESGGEYNPADANKTRLSDYARRFSGQGGTQTARTPPAVADQRSSSAIAAPPPVRAEGTISAPAPAPAAPTRDPNEGINTDSNRVRNLGPVAGGVLDALFGRRNPTADQLQSGRERMADAIGLPRSELERLGQPRERAAMPPGFRYHYVDPKAEERRYLEQQRSDDRRYQTDQNNQTRRDVAAQREQDRRDRHLNNPLPVGDSNAILQRFAAAIGNDPKSPIVAVRDGMGNVIGLKPRMTQGSEVRDWQQRILQAQSAAERAFTQSRLEEDRSKWLTHAEAAQRGLEHLLPQTSTPTPSPRTAPGGAPGTAAAAPAAPTPVNTPAEAARLPPGTRFVTPDGTIREVPRR